MVNGQEFLNAIYQDIEMVKGDTMSFNFQVAGLGGIENTVKFTCKANPSDEQPLFMYNAVVENYQETTDTTTYTVRIPPNATSQLDTARYYYDLQLSTASDVLTLMRGRLTLLYEVSE